MSIFDRYLLRRYWHVFGIAFSALFGLYFVIDVFTNVSDFFEVPGGTLAIVEYMARYYGYRACYFFGVIGGTLEVIAAMVALALVQKHGELNPILSAGISTFRLMRPLVVGALLVNGVIFLNQELVIPRIALELQMSAGARTDVSYYCEPVMDFETQIMITAKKLNLTEQTIEEAEFSLSLRVSEKLTTISAKKATPIPAKGRRRGGWLLEGSSQRFDLLPLTDLGKKIIRPGKTNEELIILTDVGFDRLYNKDKHYEYISTWELMRRIRNPSFSHRSIRSHSLYLHTRLTKPLLNLIVVGVGVPFVVRKESVSLLTNLAICGGVMGAMFAVNELFQYLGKVSLLSPEVAVWAPIIIWGSAAAWFTGLVRT
ncbi:MAG: LptF/LptG family permease [Planctomycetaceae bacterium]|nr:LptF/LptG family permease [Planctomycetaceae bacterium]